MSDPIDDKAFEEYLERGSAVSQQYRSLHASDVPAQIDEKILAQAHQAIRSPLAERTQRWKKWTVPVALAASTVIAVSIVLESGVRHEVASGVTTTSSRSAQELIAREEVQRKAAHSQDRARQDKAREEAKAVVAPGETVVQVETSVQPAAPPALEAPMFSPEPSVADEPAQQVEKQARQEAAQTSLEREDRRSSEEDQAAGAAADASAPVPETQYSAARSQRPVPASAPPRQKSADESSVSAGSASVAEQMQSQVARDPEQWLVDIRALRLAGRIEEADREWKQFETMFPDYEVAKDDVARPQ